jgi:hypothetical protein
VVPRPSWSLLPTPVYKTTSAYPSGTSAWLPPGTLVPPHVRPRIRRIPKARQSLPGFWAIPEPSSHTRLASSSTTAVIVSRARIFSLFGRSSATCMIKHGVPYSPAASLIKVRSYFKSLPFRHWPPAFPPCLPIDDKTERRTSGICTLLRAWIQPRGSLVRRRPFYEPKPSPRAVAYSLFARTSSCVSQTSSRRAVVPSRRHTHAVTHSLSCRPTVPPFRADDPVCVVAPSSS